MADLGFEFGSGDYPLRRSARAVLCQQVRRSGFGPLGGRGNWLGTFLGRVDPARRQEYPQGCMHGPRLRT